ncbi:MAG: hypothetical protein ACM3X5_08920 [Bacillota bacterium]
MPKSKGIHAHAYFKLGKAAAKKDPRNLKMATLFKMAMPKPPATYDYDVNHHAPIPLHMFANDVLGDCVMAGRAHQTLRFEWIEQKKIVQITDKDVEREYYKETGGPDSGLVVLDSLKEWRTGGWKVGKINYKIRAFAEIDFAVHDELKQAIYADVGVGIGVQLPISAQAQTGHVWDVTTGPNAVPGSWGGHYVYVVGYDPTGPVCITWGRKQQMTWAWLDKYCDEAYAIFDAVDHFKKELIEAKKISQFLKTLKQPVPA